MVSAWNVAEELAPLDPIASVTLESLDDRVKDDDVSKELLDVTSADELDCAASEELDSSIVLLSPPSGPELLVSSPQAARTMPKTSAKYADKNILCFILCFLCRFALNLLNLHTYFHGKAVKSVNVAVINTIQHTNKSLFIINMHR